MFHLKKEVFNLDILQSVLNTIVECFLSYDFMISLFLRKFFLKKYRIDILE